MNVPIYLWTRLGKVQYPRWRRVPVRVALISSHGVSAQEQVILYTLLLRMRYGYDASPSGLLVYTAADSLHTGKPETMPRTCFSVCGVPPTEDAVRLFTCHRPS